MHDVRTITVDLDDTLWEIGPVIRRAERKLYEWLESNYPRVTEAFTPETIMELRKQVMEEFPDRCYDFVFLRRTVLGRLGSAVGYGEGLVDDAMGVFLEHRNDVELFPEVRSALTVLREEYRVIALTNGNADVAMIGIADLFHEVISATMAGAAKPHRRIFDVAVDAGGAPPEQTLHVGDHPEVDIAGAHNAGLKAVWVNRNGCEWPESLRPPDGIVADMEQLLSLLREAGR